MNIQKAKDARTSFEIAAERNLAKEREMEAFARHLEEERAAREKKLRLAKAAASRLNSRLVRQLIVESGQGSKFTALSSSALSLSTELKSQALQVLTVAELRKEVEAQLLKIEDYPQKPIMSFPEKAILPLRKFLMITLLRAWRSRENEMKVLEFHADLVLRGLISDLKGRDTEHALRRYEHLCSLDSDNRHSELQLRDFLIDREEYNSIKPLCTQDILDIYIEVEREPELVSVLNTLTRAVSRAIQTAISNQERASDNKSEYHTLLDSLDSLDDSQYVACWLHAELWSPNSPPKDLAGQLRWLSSSAGQRLILEVGEQISRMSRHGKATETVLCFSSDEGNLYSAEIFIMYLKAFGYKCTLVSKGTKNSAEYKISW